MEELEKAYRGVNEAYTELGRCHALAFSQMCSRYRGRAEFASVMDFITRIHPASMVSSTWPDEFQSSLGEGANTYMDVAYAYLTFLQAASENLDNMLGGVLSRVTFTGNKAHNQEAFATMREGRFSVSELLEILEEKPHLVFPIVTVFFPVITKEIMKEQQ